MSEQPSNEDKKPWYRSNAFIIAVVTACLGFIFGIAQWAITRDPEPGDVAAFCEALRSNTNLNAVMAGYVRQLGSSQAGPDPQQVAQVSNDLVRASDRAATLSPKQIKPNVREYARLQDQIDRHLALHQYRLYSTNEDEHREVTKLFEPMTKEMFTIELWARDNC